MTPADRLARAADVLDAMADDATQMKTCSKCRVEKRVDSFSRDRARRDGRQPQCKECRNAHRAENREAILDRERAHYAEHQQQHVERSRQYRAANTESIRERRGAYWRANADAILERQRQYYSENSDRILEQQREYRSGNSDRISEYRRENPHVGWAHNYRSRALKAGFEATVEDFTKADVIARYGSSCFYCDTGTFDHLDHYIPVSKGGAHTLANVRPACEPCNRAKGSALADHILERTTDE